MAKFQISDGNDTSVLAKVNTSGNVQVDLEEASSIIPIDIQSHYASTVQTHNAVSVGASSSSTQSSWIDCDGFDRIGITLLNDAITSKRVAVYWSNDGTSNHGYEPNAIPVDTSYQYQATEISIKARYAKLVVVNGDTIAHTMSAWAYLKA